MKAAGVKRLDTFEMWLRRRMPKIPWEAKVTNVESESHTRIVKRIKLSYFGHIMRNNTYHLLQLRCRAEEVFLGCET